MPEHLTIVLKYLAQIRQGSSDTPIFMTRRPHVQSEMERKLDGAATFVFIQTTEDGVLIYLHEKLRRDTAMNTMSSTLEGDIMKAIPAIGLETYVGTRAGAKPPQIHG